MATVVISPPGAKSSLISLYFDALESTTITELETYVQCNHCHIARMIIISKPRLHITSVYFFHALLPHSVTNRLYNLLSVGTQVGSTTVFVNGEDQIQSDTTQYIVNTVTSKASTRYVKLALGTVNSVIYAGKI